MSVDPAGDRQRDLTVAGVRARPGLDFVEVVFLESARFFRLSRSHADFDRLLTALRASETGGRPVRVIVTEPHGGEIDDVQNV